MKIFKFETIYQLSFYPSLFPINCYLVEEENHLVLIDTGMSFCLTPIINAVQKIGKPLNKILLTHGHDDHVGALDGLVLNFPDVEVLISKRDSKLLKGDCSLLADESILPIKGGVPKNIVTQPTSYIEDGQMIGSLLPIHTPGHTPGHMSFLDVRNKSLIVGDAMQTKGGVTVCGQFKWRFPFPAWATRDKSEAVYSVEKLMEYEPALLLVGHGPAVRNPLPHMERAIKQAKGGMRNGA